MMGRIAPTVISAKSFVKSDGHAIVEGERRQDQHQPKEGENPLAQRRDRWPLDQHREDAAAENNHARSQIANIGSQLCGRPKSTST